jgi:hypothetical protein
MIFIVFVLMALSLGILIGRNLKIIEYQEREEYLRKEIAETHSQLMRLRTMARPTPEDLLSRHRAKTEL